MRLKPTTRIPKSLADAEWNLLLELTTYNHMDDWFELRSRKDGTDYVMDLESGRPIALRTAIRQVAEGLYAPDLKLFDDGLSVWNGLMARFGLVEHRVDGTELED